MLNKIASVLCFVPTIHVFNFCPYHIKVMSLVYYLIDLETICWQFYHLFVCINYTKTCVLCEKTQFIFNRRLRRNLTIGKKFRNFSFNDLLRIIERHDRSCYMT